MTSFSSSAAREIFWYSSFDLLVHCNIPQICNQLHVEALPITHPRPLLPQDEGSHMLLATPRLLQLQLLKNKTDKTDIDEVYEYSRFFLQ